jgi:hypothetical protein
MTNDLPDVSWYERPVREGENHGFAPGDRVQITQGEFKGDIGWVQRSSAGCGGSCATKCHVVGVVKDQDDLGARALPTDLQDVDAWEAYYEWDRDHVVHLIPTEVTHID